MFSTTPKAISSSAVTRRDASQRNCTDAGSRWMPSVPPLPVFGHLAPHSVAAFPSMTETMPAKTSHGSVASTRATSPSSSTTASDSEGTGQLLHADSGALARRRGCKMLCLTELIVDGDADGGSPSGDSSTSSSDTTTASANPSSKMCTPFTPQMMSFSPCPGSTTADGTARPLITEPKVTPNQMVENTMMRTTPVRTDASQRSAPFASRRPLQPLGVAAAGGDASQRKAPSAQGTHAASAGHDASQRTPAGRVSLGVAVIGGDASQRSPPGCIKTVIDCDPTRRCFAAASTCPASPQDACCTTLPDASQRIPAGSGATHVSADCGNDALKSWLLASFCNSSPQSSEELAQKLLAALPESYED